MSDRYPSPRARAQARQQEHRAAERRTQRLFWVGLIVPALACAAVALLVGPDSWLGWALVVATAPAAAAGLAIVIALRDWKTGRQ